MIGKVFNIPSIISLIFLLLFNSFAFATESRQDTLRQGANNESSLGVTEVADDLNVSQRIDQAFRPIVDAIGSVLFWDPFTAMGLYDPLIYDKDGNPELDADGNQKESHIPLVVIWLIIGAVGFTFYFRFINFRGFKHAIQIVQGKYDDPNHAGEVSHFQALTTALSATVGLGNIASVAIAVSIGGAGATFWMILAGLLGMSSKFTECTLGVKYRQIDKHGVVSGGAMYYLRDGLKKKGMKKLGAVLAFIFAILVIGGSLGGGNMFQVNQAFAQFEYLAPQIADMDIYFGGFMALLVGIVVIGGIKSIAKVTDKIVPFMAAMYVGTALIIIFMNIENTGEAFMMIINGAFGENAIKGGFVGVLIIGFKRAAFSNEAGVGSAAIAHSAVKTDTPVTEGFVALLEPFVDTVVICTMTALVLIFTGFAENTGGLEGAQLTSKAFASVIPWFPYLLAVAIFLFAFSTMIAWSYYGLKGFDYLFGDLAEKYLKNRKISNYIFFTIFLLFIIVGAVSDLGSVLDFSDMMILSMAFPNILGLIILAPEVKADLVTYWDKLKSGEIKRFK